MAQTTILASGTTAANSTDIVVAAGDDVKVCIFSVNPGASLSGKSLDVYEKTAGASNFLGSLDTTNPSTILCGPGTYFVSRPVLAIAYGVNLDA